MNRNIRMGFERLVGLIYSYYYNKNITSFKNSNLELQNNIRNIRVNDEYILKNYKKFCKKNTNIFIKSWNSR